MICTNKNKKYCPSKDFLMQEFISIGHLIDNFFMKEDLS